MSDWLWVWIGVAVGFAIIEVVTPVLFFAISFTVGALVAAGAAGVEASSGIQWVAFIAGSAGALAVLVPVGRRITHAAHEGDDEAEGAARWVGRCAVVLEEIPGALHATGLVRLERAQWRAETDASRPIAPGTEVEVIAVRGARLVVAPLHPPS